MSSLSTTVEEARQSFQKWWIDKVMDPNDPKAFMRFSSFCLIRTKEGKAKPFSPKTWHVEQQRLYKNMSGWDLILKGRQIGMSTFGMIYMLWFSLTHPTTLSVLIVQDDKARQVLMNTIRFALNGIEEKGKELGINLIPPTSYSNVSHIQFDVIHSEIRCDVAKKDEASASWSGRSATIHYLHVTELAQFTAASTVLGSYLQSLAPSARVMIESTPRGTNNIFYELWKDTKESNTPYRSHFFPWFEHKHYIFRLGKEENPLDFSPKNEWEDLLVNKFLCQPDQLKYWRNHIVQSQCSGDIDLALQEYPLSDDICFRTKEGSFFKPSELSAYRSLVEAPIHLEPWRKTTVSSWVSEEDLDNRPIILAIDPAVGTSGKGDDTAIIGVFKDTGALALRWNSNRTPYDLIPSLLEHIMNCWDIESIIIERNHESGVGIIKSMVNKGHLNILASHKGKLGWSTDQESRPRMMNLMINAIRTAAFDIPDSIFIDQLNDLVIKDERLEAKSGCHDDMLIAWSIAQSLRHRILNGGQGSKSALRSNRLYHRNNDSIPTDQKNRRSTTTRTRIRLPGDRSRFGQF